ncbi:hypothetical protein GGF31_000893 [Allomyces arbusculus]|nr:hypothetical protein GGF31_000893 [Allomyces arbusculus]
MCPFWFDLEVHPNTRFLAAPLDGIVEDEEENAEAKHESNALGSTLDQVLGGLQSVVHELMPMAYPIDMSVHVACLQAHVRRGARRYYKGAGTVLQMTEMQFQSFASADHAAGAGKAGGTAMMEGGMDARLLLDF